MTIMDYKQITKGKLYQWRSTGLVVLARSGDRLCVDPDSDFYREYVFKGRIVGSDHTEEIGTLTMFAAAGGWEDAT